MPPSTSTLISLGALIFGAFAVQQCSPDSISKPSLLGATIHGLQADEVHNYTAVSLGPGTNEGGRYTISFCNVTVVHTHLDWNDTVTTQVWLPLDDWNGRFQGLGGGGYSTGFGSIYLTYAVSQGFAAASTDGGVPGDSSTVTTIATDLSWALTSDHNINWALLKNYAYKATADLAEIGKQITDSYYDRPAEYSYFNGCSGGGRQGLAMAQQFPDAFDGILTVAPAINIETFIPAGFWPTLVMNQDGIYPSSCEIDGFVSAAVNACDELDGVKDSIISRPDLCNVTALDFVGKPFTCNGTQHALSPSAAKVVQAAWSGSYIPTECTSNRTCSTLGSALFGNWISYLVAKDPSFNLDNMTPPEFFSSLADSRNDYASMLAANNADLSDFKARGKKIITWHGLADEVIPIQGLVEYYKNVLEQDRYAGDFFRFLEAPGVGHCFGGPGPVPNGALGQLMDWVENGIAPDTLHATRGSNNTARDLCPYPLKQRYAGGDPAVVSSFTCV
ncbi:Tannase/feruloyl esterase [Aspergillus karnatakaensis]|uniref:Tannase/feruloyl esterase n=1 Tax=Aspergillus karnatakaensis TaxID=1810916 RepID=UPI003CCD812E